jgi:hypothetical protein
MYLRREIPRVAPARLGSRSNGRQLRAGRSLDSLTSFVPVEIPLKQLVARLVQLSTLLSSRHLSAVITASDFDVESLGPELPLAHVAVVVDRYDLRAQNVVSAGDLAGDGDALRVFLVVEDRVGAPVSGLALSGAVRVATLAVRLLDVLAVAVARSEVGGGPAVVGAVPAFFASTA